MSIVSYCSQRDSSAEGLVDLLTEENGTYVSTDVKVTIFAGDIFVD